MQSVRDVSTRSLALAALGAISAFPVLVVLLNLIQHDRYNAAGEAMSNLALGRAGWIMTVAFCSLAVGSLLLAATIRRSVQGAVVAPLLLTIVGLLTFVSAAFQTDPDGAPATLHGQIHMAAGITTFVVLILTIAAGAAAFHRSPAWRSFRNLSAAWAVVAFGTFFLVPTLDAAHFGVAQRIFVGTCLAWMLATAWRASRMERPAEVKGLAPAQVAASGAG